MNEKNNHIMQENPPKNLSGIKRFYWKFNRFLEKHLPDKLYPRSILIVIMPVILLQAVIAVVFMERHWNQITVKLSRSVAREITLLEQIKDYYANDPTIQDFLIQRGKADLAFDITFINADTLPPIPPKPIFSPLYHRLQIQLNKWIKNPFQLTINSEKKEVIIYVMLRDNLIMRLDAPQSRVYSSNSYIFIIWMISSSLILITVALLFLRNQIKPIQQLAQAAQEFHVDDLNIDDMEKQNTHPTEFKPHGATEVRQAAQSFDTMKKQIQNHIKQRTDMLAGVSHDLRTILTRFRLQLELLSEPELKKNLIEDVKEMEYIIEEYISFFKSGKDESPQNIKTIPFIQEIINAVSKVRQTITFTADNTIDETIRIKPKSLKRAIVNLIDNANHHANTITIKAQTETFPHIAEQPCLAIIIDDDGVGIQEEQREHAFKAFSRLEQAHKKKHNQEVEHNQGAEHYQRAGQYQGAGLGLPIARNIARDHGGDIILETAPIGGLRAILIINPHHHKT